MQIDQALACIDFSQGAIGPITPDLEAKTPVTRERLFYCKYFYLWRLKGKSPFVVGKMGTLRVVVGIAGAGQLEYNGVSYAVGKGDVLLLPAVVGECAFRPHCEVTLLEIAIPE